MSNKDEINKQFQEAILLLLGIMSKDLNKIDKRLDNIENRINQNRETGK